MKVVQGWLLSYRKGAIRSSYCTVEWRKPGYSAAVVETLSESIAYRQPIIRTEIGQIRGVSISKKILRLLQEREWIKITGREVKC